MALFLYLNRNVFGWCLRRNIFTGAVCHNYNACSNFISIEVDSMEMFTTRLIQNKVDKWSGTKSVPEVIRSVSAEECCAASISHLSITRINTLFEEAVEMNDNEKILELMKQCLILNITPTQSNILSALSVCSQNGEVLAIKEIHKLCKNINPQIVETHADFKHYIAEATWVRGNIPEALKLFKEVYKQSTISRRRIRLMLRNLIIDITNRSEAMLVNIVSFAENIAKEYEDFFPLTCIWQVCFLSEWYSDQNLAFNLMKKHDDLCFAVVSRIPYVVALSLYNHRTDVVYRLLEILLTFEMKQQYEGVLLALLDYQIRQRDLRRCLEIIQWSAQNDIHLLPVQHENFFKLLIGKNDKTLTLKKHSKPLQLLKITSYKF